MQKRKSGKKNPNYEKKKVNEAKKMHIPGKMTLV